MPKTRPQLEPGNQLEDYILGELLSEDHERQLWLAHQQSINREVEVEIYFGPDEAEYLENVRVKASVDDGVLGLVYGAIPGDGAVGVVREVLPQQSLADLNTQAEHLLPKQVTGIIRQVARALGSLHQQGLAYEPFDSRDIRLAPHGVVRMRNVARSSQPAEDSASRVDFVQALRQVLQTGHPGATRMATLLQYIEGSPEQTAISWQEADQLASQVEEQLNTPEPPPAPHSESESKTQKKSPLLPLLLIATVFITLGALALFLQQSDSITVDVAQISTIPAGTYTGPNGDKVQLDQFRIDAHEVTIGEYDAFLVAYQALSQEARQKLHPEDLPETKIHFRPENWREILTLAREERPLKGLPLTLDCPVTGIDWWDAYTYAAWKGGRLPTTVEWWAAASVQQDGEPTAWGPVQGSGEGPFGMSGNVMEWMLEQNHNPAFPMDAKKPLACGGTFLQPERGALSREWLESRDLRRGDLGFRVVY
ncbi:MAG: SUMF1/EgtB/PvdO family nonheme iron enzyme [Verrucomicrobiota bacterium]